MIMQKTLELKLDLPTNLSKEEVQIFLAMKLYEAEKLSLGQAAKLAGYSKRSFMEILGQNKISIFNYSPAELLEDLSL
jgi:predicted HTH domain antitoxin